MKLVVSLCLTFALISIVLAGGPYPPPPPPIPQGDCPTDRPPQVCPVPPCADKKCPSFPGFRCVNDQCGGCFAKLYDGPVPLDEKQCNRCPSNQVYYRSFRPCLKRCYGVPSHCPDGCFPNAGCSCLPGLYWNGRECVANCGPCPPGVALAKCTADPCTNAVCPAFSDAICNSDFCGGCNAIFTLGGNKLTNFDCNPTNCPPGSTVVNCLVNPCDGHHCPQVPGAKCVANFCGGCNAVFYDNGRKLKAAECVTKCPGGKTYHRCKPCESDCLPGLPRPELGCVPGCACPKGTFWSKNWKHCVKREHCSCPKHQIYHACKPCGNDCKYANDPLTCIAQCQPGCGCPRGTYWNEATKNCVQKAQCGQVCISNQVYFPKCKPCLNECDKKLQVCPAICQSGCSCPRTMKWDGENCVPACPRQLCQKKGQVLHKCKPCGRECKYAYKPVACTLECKPGCACRKDYYWHPSKNECVRKLQCLPSPTVCLRKGQVPHVCKPCDRDCRFAYNPIACRQPCKPGCACRKDFYWNSKKNMCVRKNQCPRPAGCPNGQIPHRCKPCGRDCKDALKPTKVCTLACKPGCACRKDFFWHPTRRTCVRKSQCPRKPPSLCRNGQVLHRCKPCGRDCKDAFKPTKICTLACKPGCACKKDFFWHPIRRTCVRKLQCPRIPPSQCPSGQTLYRCKPCGRNCKDAHNPFSVCTLDCKPGCACKNDFFWHPIRRTCVRKSQCPGKPPSSCPSGQVLHRCKPCGRDCKDAHNPFSVCTLGCKPGCACKRDFFWHPIRRTCVRKSQCPRKIPSVVPKCPPTQVYSSKCIRCVPKCPGPVPTITPCTKPCISRCTCPPRKFLNPISQRCVSLAKCPRVIG